MTSTITFDEAALTRLSDQRPEAPWGRRTASFRTVVILAVLIPAAIVTMLFWFSSIPGAVIMVAIYLPLQVLAAVMAAIVVRGTKSAADAVIIVSAIGATIFSLVVLISLLWSPRASRR
jgi:hypothetical protein